MLIAAPHTSNWDLAGLLLCAAAFEIKITWMGKHGLFFPPLGWLMRALGGIGNLRVSTHFFNTEEDIDYLIDLQKQML